MPLPQDIQRLVILMPSWVGDVVMASCVWKMAREKYPNATITAAIRPHLAPLLDGVEELDSVLPLDIKSSVFCAGRKLKKLHADTIILLPNSVRSAVIARLAKIKNRAGYKRDWRSWLLTDGVEVQKQNTPTPTSNYYLYLANELFEMQSENVIPSIAMSHSQENILRDFSKPIVLFVPGASKPQKRWSPKRFAEVADALHELGATCCGIGSPEEYELVQEIVNAAESPMHNLTRSGVTLGSLKDIVRQADLVITNDTGPRHIAVACGTPAITMYGPTDYRWTKYECNNDIALLADPFLPEHLVANSNPVRCDINNIPSSDVVAVAKQFVTSSR